MASEIHAAPQISWTAPLGPRHVPVDAPDNALDIPLLIPEVGSRDAYASKWGVNRKHSSTEFGNRNTAWEMNSISAEVYLHNNNIWVFK